MVDNVYWIWQALHPDEAREIDGTLTIFNDPPSHDAVKEDPLEMLVLGETITIEDALDTMAGKFCYVYV